MPKHYQTKVSTKPSQGFKNEQPSMTKKDEAYTLQELFNRSQHGIDPEEVKTNYLEVEDFNQISPLFNAGNVDLTDIQALNESIAQAQDRIDQAMLQIEKDKAEEKRQAEIDKAVEEKLEQQKIEEPT